MRFPRKSVLEAIRALEDDHGPEVDELAASVVVVALQRGESVPRRTVTLLLVVLKRNLGTPLASKLALALSKFIEDFAVLVLGHHLVGHKDSLLRGHRRADPPEVVEPTALISPGTPVESGC